MRLFHVSEEPDIRRFDPRPPTRSDLDPALKLVWALEESCLPNFLTPRNCPRVAYHVGTETSDADRYRWFSSPTATHALVIEHRWLEAFRRTTLYLYEFDPTGFSLQDEIAGYYVSTLPQTPVARHVISDLPAELQRRDVEFRAVDDLWTVADEIQATTLLWSLCRMSFAQPRRT